MFEKACWETCCRRRTTNAWTRYDVCRLCSILYLNICVYSKAFPGKIILFTNSLHVRDQRKAKLSLPLSAIQHHPERVLHGRRGPNESKPHAQEATIRVHLLQHPHHINQTAEQRPIQQSRAKYLSRVLPLHAPLRKGSEAGR
jgi:hypothetical protein